MSRSCASLDHISHAVGKCFRGDGASRISAAGGQPMLKTALILVASASALGLATLSLAQESPDERFMPVGSDPNWYLQRASCMLAHNVNGVSRDLIRLQGVMGVSLEVMGERPRVRNNDNASDPRAGRWRRGGNIWDRPRMGGRWAQRLPDSGQRRTARQDEHGPPARDQGRRAEFSCDRSRRRGPGDRRDARLL